ncbi:MAG: carboxypeptidase-like regulatory domain-containing protein [Anaerolineae bacterium]
MRATAERLASGDRASGGGIAAHGAGEPPSRGAGRSRRRRWLRAIAAAAALVLMLRSLDIVAAHARSGSVLGRMHAVVQRFDAALRDAFVGPSAVERVGRTDRAGGPTPTAAADASGGARGGDRRRRRVADGAGLGRRASTPAAPAAPATRRPSWAPASASGLADPRRRLAAAPPPRTPSARPSDPPSPASNLDPVGSTSPPMARPRAASSTALPTATSTPLPPSSPSPTALPPASPTAPAPPSTTPPPQAPPAATATLGTPSRCAGIVQGTVRSQLRQVVANALVVAETTASNAPAEATSGADGQYALTRLCPGGPYAIRVRTVDGMAVDASTTVTVTLAVGEPARTGVDLVVTLANPARPAPATPPAPSPTVPPLAVSTASAPVAAPPAATPGDPVEH